MAKTNSTTKKDSFAEESIVHGSHYKTIISDGKEKVEGLGKTPEEAEKRASEKWDENEDDEDEG